MVTRAELAQRTGIQQVVLARARQEAQRQAQLRTQQQIQTVQPRPTTFQVTVIDRGGGQTPQTLSVVRTFATRAEAERFAREERAEFADKDTPVGVRQTPSATQAAATPRFQGREITGPPPSELGRKLQNIRLEEERAERAAEKLEAGKPLARREEQALGRSEFIVDKGLPTERVITGKQLGEQIIEARKEVEIKKQVQPVAEKLRKDVGISLIKKLEAKAVEKAAKATTILKEPVVITTKEITPSFTPTRPVAATETIIIPPPKIPRPETLGLEERAGTISAAPKAERITGEVTPIDIEKVTQLGRQLKAESRARALISDTDLKKTLKAEFELGLAEAKAAIPEAAGFAALAAVTPAGAAAVGGAATIVAVPQLQREIAAKGLLRTAIRTLPTLGLFTGAGGIGAGIRRSPTVRKQLFEAKIESLVAKDVDPTFKFERKPFVSVSETPPKFLQRTLKGEVITPEKQRFLLSEIQRISREEARQLDIFNPQIERQILKDVTIESPRTRLIQTQLRETFLTPEQVGVFRAEQIARATQIPQTPRRQATLLDFFKSKKAQLLIKRPRLFFQIFFREIRIKPKRQIPEVVERTILTVRPRQLRTPTTLTRTPTTLTRTLQLQRQIAIQRPRTETLLEAKPTPIQIQLPKARPIEEVDILQGTRLRTETEQRLLQEQITQQRQKARALTIQQTKSVLEPFKESLKEKPKPKVPKIRRPLDPKPLFDLAKPKEPSNKGYDIEINRGEKRGAGKVTEKVNLPKNKALRRLRFILDNFIEASGRIKPSKKKTKIKDDLVAPSLNKFRPPVKKSKLSKDTLVEKRGNRLDTAGELKQLSFFKELAKKKKKIKQKVKKLKTFPSISKNNNILKRGGLL